MKRVLVFANQQLGIDCLEILKKNKQTRLLGVVGCETEADIKQGYPSIKKYSKENGLRYFNPQKLDGQFLKQFKKLRPDVCFALMYRNFFNKDYLKVPKMGIINFHPAPLPKYRGPIPWVWAMVKGEEEAGITMHYMDEGIDTGDIIAQKKVKIGEMESGFELLYRLMSEGVKLFAKQLPQVLAGKNARVKQNNRQATYFGPFHEKIRTIDWHEESRILLRKINAVTKPYKGALANFMGEEMVIWKAKKALSSKRVLRGPGRVLKLNSDGSFIVTTVDGFLEVFDYDFKTTSNKQSLRSDDLKQSFSANEPRLSANKLKKILKEGSRFLN